MSTSVVEYSSSEQLVINISVFYIGVIIYTISLFYLLISSFHFKKKLDKLGDSLEDVNYNLHEEIKDTFGNFLQNKLVEVNDELLEEIDEVNCRLIKKIDAERKLRIDQYKQLIHLKKEIVRLSETLISKLKFDDAFSLYTESPEFCEAKHYLFLLKNIDRIRRPETFKKIAEKSMDKFQCMTNRRDSVIVDLIRFFIESKLITGTREYGVFSGVLSPLDFSKGLDEVKNDIFRTYTSFSDLDKEWLNLNVFRNINKPF